MPRLIRALVLSCLFASAPAPAEASPLFDAIREGDTNEVRALIASGVDVNAPFSDHRDADPLCVAVDVAEGRAGAPKKEGLSESLDIVQLLIEAGADVNARSPFGTPLWIAAHDNRDKSVELVQVLLDAGADMNSRGRDESTALMQAANANARQIIRLLLAAGADVAARDCTGATALHAAVRLTEGGVPDIEVIRAIVNGGADVNARDELGWTPLLDAARSADMRAMWMLLGLGANPRATTNEGWTAIMIAAASDDPYWWREWLLQLEGLRAKAEGREPPGSIDFQYPAMLASYGDMRGPSGKVWTLLRYSPEDLMPAVGGPCDPDARNDQGERVDEILGARTDPEAKLIRAALEIARGDKIRWTGKSIDEALGSWPKPVGLPDRAEPVHPAPR